MISLNHFYIDMDYLIVNRENILKQSHKFVDGINFGDFDIEIPHSEFKNVLIPFSNILCNEDKNGIPVSTWSNRDDETFFCVEFRLADDVFIVPYETVKLIQDVSDFTEYNPLRKFAS